MEDQALVELRSPGTTHARGVDRRVATRLPLAPGVATLAWHSSAGGLETAAIVDLTPEGTQLRLAPHSAGPPAYGPFPAELTIGAERVECVAEQRQRGVDERRVGLRLTTDPQQHALADLYLAQRFPRLQPRSLVAPAQLAEMLRRSGYLGLREGNQASNAWCGLQLPNASSCDVVYVARDGSLLGHISVSRVYSDSWLFHQLATLSGHEETVESRKELYGLISSAPRIYSGDKAHGLAYFDLDKRWHRLFFEEFTARIGDPHEACITKLDRFERSERGLVEAPVVAGYRAELASRSELIGATAMVRDQLPPILADTLDISPWRLRSSALCGDRSYTRSREVIVLRGPAGIEGVALCELGSAELSLFGILDMAHVFIARSRPSRDAQRVLLARVRAHYAEHRIANPIVVSPHATLEAEAEPGTRLVETMGAISMSSRAIRDWESFCQVHFSHQLTRTLPFKKLQPGDLRS